MLPIYLDFSEDVSMSSLSQEADLCLEERCTSTIFIKCRKPHCLRAALASREILAAAGMQQPVCGISECSLGFYVLVCKTIVGRAGKLAAHTYPPHPPL